MNIFVFTLLLCLASLTQADVATGIADKLTGKQLQGGCYKGFCWSYCDGLTNAKLWCYTNKNAGAGKKSCTTDDSCRGSFNKCQGACTW